MKLLLQLTFMVSVMALLAPCLTAQRPNTATRAPVKGNWKLSETKNIDGIPLAMLELSSDSLIFEQPVKLQIRCSDAQNPKAVRIWVWFIYEPDFVSKNAEIQPNVRIDMADIRTRVDQEPAAFLPNIHERKERGLMIMDSASLISKLREGQKLLLEFTPIDRPKQIASFTLLGIAEQFKRLPCASNK